MISTALLLIGMSLAQAADKPPNLPIVGSQGLKALGEMALQKKEERLKREAREEKRKVEFDERAKTILSVRMAMDRLLDRLEVLSNQTKLSPEEALHDFYHQEMPNFEDVTWWRTLDGEPRKQEYQGQTYWVELVVHNWEDALLLEGLIAEELARLTPVPKSPYRDAAVPTVAEENPDEKNIEKIARRKQNLILLADFVAEKASGQKWNLDLNAAKANWGVTHPSKWRLTYFVSISAFIGALEFLHAEHIGAFLGGWALGTVPTLVKREWDKSVAQTKIEKTWFEEKTTRQQKTRAHLLDHFLGSLEQRWATEIPIAARHALILGDIRVLQSLACAEALGAPLEKEHVRISSEAPPRVRVAEQAEILAEENAVIDQALLQMRSSKEQK